MHMMCKKSMGSVRYCVIGGCSTAASVDLGLCFVPLLVLRLILV